MSALSRADDRERASQEFFDRWAGGYDKGRLSSWFQYTQHLAIDNLDFERNSWILDVGCGTGYATVTLAARLPNGKACGIDISAAMIEQARAKVPAYLEPRLEFQQANSAELPYPDRTFTHVICTNSFHHYPDPLKVLREMRRVLKPGGQLVIFENAPDLSWYTWAWDRLLRLVEKGHVRYYPSHELGGMIGRGGFEKVELRLLRKEFLKHGKLFASIQIWSARRPTASPAKSDDLLPRETMAIARPQLAARRRWPRRES